MNPKLCSRAAVCFALTLAPASCMAATGGVGGADPFGGSESYGQALIRMLLTLGGLILALLVLARILPRIMPNLVKKYKRQVPTGGIEVVDACRLNAQTQLYLVRVEGQRFLISVSDKGTTLLGELQSSTPKTTADASPAAASEVPTETFIDLLRATRPPVDR